ncbi:hypothetical protein GCM10010289_10190 [Streptomyces violascens]|uniref:Uncharacterized protein n=1 Tax=Streptomyces violascens TaxID=67381 RepID=A0ABQ3QHH9_9ACTN|nr:hypothetical protein GCM10010289_10190 [Streptomyces violascens]GHI36684.1 hypothetical protein Sviol_10920 [Streptomyces violascens]
MSLAWSLSVLGPLNPADPPRAGSAGLSGKGQLRAPPKGAAAVTASAAVKTAAFGASATADGAAGKAYLDMSPIIPGGRRRVEWFSAGGS